MMRSGFLIAILAMAAASCGQDEEAAPLVNGNLAAGTWGGDNAGLILEDTIAHVHVGCTYGNFPAPIKPTSSGTFSLNGSYMVRAYPIAIGPAVPARMDGSVRGNDITLYVTVNDTVEKKTVTYGPVTVTYKQDPKLGPCPICRKAKALPSERGDAAAPARKRPAHH